MTTKQGTPVHRRFALVALVGLALAWGAHAGLEAGGRAGPPASAAGTLVGTWRVEITLRNCETGEAVSSPFPALATFAQGGTMTTSDGGLSPAARGAGHGVWEQVRPGRFAALTEAFLFASTGALTGTQRLSQEIAMRGGGTAFDARVSAAVVNTAGQVVFAGCATSEGQRIDR